MVQAKRAFMVIDIVKEIEMKEKLRQIDELFGSLPGSKQGGKSKMSTKIKKGKKPSKEEKMKSIPERDFTGIFAKIMGIVDGAAPKSNRRETGNVKSLSFLNCDDESHTSATDEASWYSSSSSFGSNETPTVSILRKPDRRAGLKKSKSQTSFCLEKNECHFIPKQRAESMPELYYSWEDIESFREDMMEEIRCEQFLWQMKNQRDRKK